MSSTPSSRPRQRAAQWPRALGWAAASLSVLFHGEVFWRLWSYAPDPKGVALPEREPLSEWAITFEAPAPLPPPPEIAPPSPATGSSAVAETPKRRRKRLPPPVAVVNTPATPAARTVTAADLQAQLDGARDLPSDDWAAAATGRSASGTGTGERDGRALDLTVRAGPGGVKGAVAAIAGVMGAPTRGDTEKVGDIHSAMLVNKWIGQHHGELFRGCDKKQPGETMATFVERCPPQAQ